MAKTIVILGAGYAGTTLAHKLLKNTLHRVHGGIKVILVTPNTHFYWNPAAVRAVIPGELADDIIFAPIEQGFAKYDKKSFEFVLGKATAVDPAANVVVISSAGAGNGNRQIRYDHLVIATGAGMAAPDMPFKLLDTTEETKKHLHELQQRIKAAKSIVVAGGGATGVETAGELGEKYGKTKKITLVMAGQRPLEMLQPKTSDIAASTLRKLDVDIIPGVKVTSQGAGKVELSDGRKLDADLYLPLYGVRPNTSFLPQQMLTAAGDVKQDAALRADGYDNIWAAGDAGGFESKQVLKAQAQAAHLAANLTAVSTGDVPKPYVIGKPMMGVSIGKKTGTGEMGGWRLFGFMIAMFKGKALMAERMGPLIAGN